VYEGEALINTAVEYYYVNDTMTYLCAEGYFVDELIGATQTITCLPTGEWEEPKNCTSQIAQCQTIPKKLIVFL
jgi:hypothetical protein